MATSENTPEIIMAQAQALIDKVQSDLEAGADFYRNQGLNPEKVHAVLQQELTPQGEQEVRQAFASDMEEIEQEVREELARSAFAAPPPSTKASRPRRSMV